MIYTTLNKIKAASPCSDGWIKLLKHLSKTKADDEPLSFSVIVESNGIDDALWAAKTAPEHDKTWRLFAVWCARQVQHLMKDERSITAIDVAERHAHGLVSDDELAAASADAGDAAWAAALADAWDAASAVARDAAWDAARVAAWVAASDAAWAVAWVAARAVAVDAAGAAAGDAGWIVAWDAARHAARDAQKAKLLEMLHEAGE